MPNSNEYYFERCLYFTANSLAREITRYAEQEFSQIGLTPSQAFLLMLVAERPGITQKELAGELNLAQSTVSRFVDSLVGKGLVAKNAEGRQVHVHPTPTGTTLMPRIFEAWKAMYENYSAVLGKKKSTDLVSDTHDASRKLSKNG